MKRLRTGGAAESRPARWSVVLFIAGVVAGPALGVAAARAQDSCGGIGAPCTVDGGIYHAALPETPAGAPMVLWLYGFGGSAEKVVGNTGFTGRFTGRGYAVIAPDALPFQDDGPRAWGFRAGWDFPRDDVAYLGAVLDDAAARFGLDRTRVLAAGFSIGGSMVWDLACLAPDAAAGYAPISGGFWEPMATECAGPVHMLHTHGFTDRTVPLEGRPIGDGDFHSQQGDIWAGLALWRRTLGCGTRADEAETDDRFWRKIWSDCDAGSLTLVLHGGGHGIPEGWTAMALDWFEALP